ncbi:hypothetical protein [Shinella sp.]|uniref:hypothetical protein n=1 Tax=Shinella sp. TaxID=1870904 RepID=UPI003F6F975B
MNSHHLIDLSRLNAIEQHRHRASGASRAAYERVKSLNERSTSLTGQLQAVRKALADRGSGAVITDGLAPSRSRREVMEGFYEKEDRLIKEIAEVDRQSAEATAISEQEMLRFSEASDLFEACKKFAKEGMAND